MPRAGLRAAVLLVGAGLATAWPAPAAAQHGTAGFAVMPMDPNTSAMLETAVGDFDLPGRAGLWQTLSARLEYAFVPRFSLSARPVLAAVDYDEGPLVTGLSDTEFAAKALVLRIRDWHASISAGASLELPTGDADEGTGNGHVSVFPFVTFSTMPSKLFMLHVMVGDRFVAAGEHHAPDPHAGHAGHAGHGASAAPHGSVIMPHGEHELSAHAGACFTLYPLVISPGFEWMQVFEPASETEIVAQFELAAQLPRGLRAAAGFDLPLVDEPRYAWRLRMMTALLF